jgi:phosphate starvation-inducible PhoH-like protein
MGKRSSVKKSKKRQELQLIEQAGGIVVDLNTYSQYMNPERKARTPSRRIQARNLAQGQYMAAIQSNQLTFGLGPAGTGKSYCAAAMAAEALETGRVDRIVFTRPSVEAEESIGFLPGKLMEKFDPYFDAFRDCLVQLLGKGVVECAMKNERVVLSPLGFMRGKTFDDSFVVLDEAQNCTRGQLKLFLTRIGERCKVVVNGDVRQTDIGGDSGLTDAVGRLRGLRGIYVHEFTRDDVVRSGLVRDILERYEEDDANARWSARY